VDADATSLQVSAPNWVPSTKGARPSDQEDVNAFLDFIQCRGLTRKTQETYRSAAETFASFTAAQGMPLLPDVTREHVESFFAALRRHGSKPASIKNRHSGLRALFNWMIEEDIRHTHPLERIKMPRVPEQVLPHYSDDDIVRVLGATPNKLGDLQGLRDRCIVLFFYDTGVRCAELCGVHVGDLDREARQATILSGKAGKQRVVAYSADVANAFNRYMRRRGGWEGVGKAAPLFAARDGAHLTVNGVRMLMQRRFAAAGVEFKGTHGFRRAAGIAFLEHGGDPTDLKELMGWSSWSMLARYTKATARSRALRAHDAHSPVARLMEKERRK
jgi:site-specific recombinase XerD